MLIILDANEILGSISFMVWGMGYGILGSIWWTSGCGGIGDGDIKMLFDGGI